MIADLHIIANVLVAFGLTFTLGFEREIRGSSAGDRTFSLIGVGTSIIGVLSAQGAPNILTGAVTGVGFIGAGLLFRQADANIATVHGVTTAAAILAASAIGAVAGSGKLLLATLATALVIISLEIRYIPGLRWLDARRWADNFKSDTDPHHGAPPKGFVVTPEPTASHEPPNARSHALGGAGVHLGATGAGHPGATGAGGHLDVTGAGHPSATGRGGHLDVAGAGGHLGTGGHLGATAAARADAAARAEAAAAGLIVAGAGVLPGAPDDSHDPAARDHRVPGARVESAFTATPQAAAQLAAAQATSDAAADEEADETPGG